MLPTLGSPTRSMDERYERLGEQSFAAEFKYDGQRAQIHGLKTKDGRISVWIFSRHLEDMTSKVTISMFVRLIFFANVNSSVSRCNVFGPFHIRTKLKHGVFHYRLRDCSNGWRQWKYTHFSRVVQPSPEECESKRNQGFGCSVRL